MTTFSKKNLTELRRDIPVKVCEVAHADKKIKHRLHAMGIYKGSTVLRKNNTLPVLLEVAGAEVALGKEFAESIFVETPQKTIFLLGNPNVGKSTIFSRLTGVKTYSSNYPGTTVNLLNGEALFYKTPYTIYDMPGVYSLEEACNDGNASCRILKNAPYDIAIHVVDANHLERNLFFAMDTISLGKPTVILLNKNDMARKKGIEIDSHKLSHMLGVPVIPCSGLTGEGFRKLQVIMHRIEHGKVQFHHAAVPTDTEEKWKLIGRISREAQKITHRHPSVLEVLEDAATAPVTGLPIALLVMIAAFSFIVFTGNHIIDLLTPLYENYYLPFVQNMFSFTKDTIVWTLLFGTSGGAAEGFGLLSEGVKVALIDVLSFVVVFYGVLEFMGDLGYLPRMAVVLDKFLHKIGLHGYSAIPVMLGLGCKVPAIMGVRTLETRRQKIIALTLILIMAPCISQTAMMFSVVGPHGFRYLVLIFAVLAITGIAAGALLNRVMEGDTTDIFMEVPEWQIPKFVPFVKKLINRTKEYLKEAVPLILAGILLISIMDATGMTTLIGKLFYYPVHYLMGLPSEVAPVISLGFFRKDVSIALLIPYNLDPKQLVIACVFMAAYLPCVASLFVLIKESGFKDAMKICALTLGSSLLVATLLNWIL